jgi:hypothetical protein
MTVNDILNTSGPLLVIDESQHVCSMCRESCNNLEEGVSFLFCHGLGHGLGHV